ncbi:winged helix-turn-helix transcriptional regulator [Azospirillum picis]|uniref:DNA-binding HxlR family transcriptional regulator n=1 Tax=Azospirillum picis TaxID=488438 RepID=A0ABU0MTC1_9PROT|nr:helix-turn-helix domain-containing protein [Azospirillum picis]MBP2302989.1 DNA-binding HxlR family transcriptional regulator [Azospirillum picis]MDQ0536741.1 DNA-binding HxlR family transcriptional regulator [Azospirillum picis]
MEDHARASYSDADLARAQSYKARDYPKQVDPAVERLVGDMMSGFADKWTVVILDTLWEDGTLRFSEIARRIDGISQKMLTQTLRRMERDGLVMRRVYASVPPKVEYTLSPLGLTLGAAFCNVWIWAVENHDAVTAARRTFDREQP